MGNIGCMQCGVHVPCCPPWGLLVLGLGRDGWRGSGPGYCVPHREPSPDGGDGGDGGVGQSQNKGPVVPGEKTQTCISLRLKLPVPGRLVPIKGTLCGSRRGEEAPGRSLGTGLTARSHSSQR